MKKPFKPTVERLKNTNQETARSESKHPRNKPHKPHKPIEKEGLGGLRSLGRGCEKQKGDGFIVPETQPPFPTESFSLDIQSIIKETSRVAQVPESLAGGVALGCLSASLGSSIKGEMVSEMFTNPNLYILGIAKSGTGKGKTFGVLQKPLNNAEAEAEETFYCSTKPQVEMELSSKKEELKEAKESGSKDDIKKLSFEIASLGKQLKEQPSLFCDDITKEALAELLSQQENETLASHSSEARGLIDTLMGQYSGNSEESIYCKLYSGDPIKVNRKSKDSSPISLKNPHLSITWLLQPDSAERLSENTAMMESGLVPRFLIFNAHAEMADEPEELLRIAPETKEAWRGICNSLLSFRNRHPEQSIITPSPEAFKILRDFSNQAKGAGRVSGVLYDLPQFPARYGENARKIALCLHASEHLENCFNTPISGEIAQKAVNLMQWFIWEQLAYLGDARYKRNYERANKLREWLSKKSDLQATLGTVKKGIKYQHDEVMNLAEEFPKLLQIKEVAHGTQGGRPSVVVSISTQVIR